MAAWSCLGFIIGLGDRHLGNLMLNLKTGEIKDDFLGEISLDVKVIKI